MSDTFEIIVRIGDYDASIGSGRLGGKTLDLANRADRELIAAMVAAWVEAP